MTPSAARAMYRRQITAHGGFVTLRRGAGGPGAEVTFIARCTGYSPQEMTGDLQQGDVKVVFLAEDLEAAIAAGDWPALAAGGAIKAKSVDAVWQDGRKMTVQAVDDQTRRVAGVLIAYELRVQG